MKLAELNVGYAAHALDDPRMAGFMNNLDAINALAERSAGFVWRMKSDTGNATDTCPYGTMLPRLGITFSTRYMPNFMNGATSGFRL